MMYRIVYNKLSDSLLLYSTKHQLHDKGVQESGGKNDDGYLSRINEE